MCGSHIENSHPKYKLAPQLPSQRSSPKSADEKIKIKIKNKTKKTKKTKRKGGQTPYPAGLASPSLTGGLGPAGRLVRLGLALAPAGLIRWLGWA
jgi:hypothetical protein